MVHVSWKDAVAYAGWLSEQTGEGWRLPSEAEWMKAAYSDRDGRKVWQYPWGNDFDSSVCNTEEGGKGATTGVGTYPKGVSGFGVQDMAGNVWEWTTGAVEAGASGGGSKRVRRGGAWNQYGTSARASARSSANSDYRDGAIGFRLVKSGYRG